VAKKTKKSRFGNPAKAAADASQRSQATPLNDVRLERTMTALSPGFVQWLETLHRSDASIDISLMILDDFFDMYRILEPQTSATALVPAAVREVINVAGSANPQASIALRRGLGDYLDYLVHASLWTGTAEELAAAKEALQLTQSPGSSDDPAAVFEDHLEMDDFDFSDVYIPEVSATAFAESIRQTPLWKNTRTILAWMGEGKAVTADRLLKAKDRKAAATCLNVIGEGVPEGIIGGADMPDRFELYWQLLEVSGLIRISDSGAHLTAQGSRALTEDEPLDLGVREMMSHFIFLTTLDGSEPGSYEDWHFDTAAILLQSASETPAKAAIFLTALKQEPAQVQPDLLFVARACAIWAAEGLLTIDEHLTVPPALRHDVYEMLREDFSISVTGPGVAVLQAELESHFAEVDPDATPTNG